MVSQGDPQANKYVLPAANKTTLGGVKQMASNARPVYGEQRLT